MRYSLACAVTSLWLFGAPVCTFAEQPANERAAASSDTGWFRLFDGKSLKGWYTKVQNQKKGEDPAKIFQVEDGVIHVYKDQAADAKVPTGYLATDKEYAYYNLRVEYKWGAKRFPPRAEGRRDAGLLYHVVGADVVWPRCIEFQIQEGDVGDCFAVHTQVVSPVETASVVTPSGPKMLPRYKLAEEGGVPKTIGDGGICRVVKSSTHEQDGWNKVELMVRGSEGSRHIVNGSTVVQTSALKQLGPSGSVPTAQGKDADKKNWVPLAKGRVALQCEYAEVFYRDIEIRPIPEGPLDGKQSE